jgi:hypothetical protein
MKETIDKSQESIEIANALEADDELSNEHIYSNSPQETEAIKKSSQSKTSEKKSKEVKNQEEYGDNKKNNGWIKKVVTTLLFLLILIVIGVGGVWVYGNKSVLFSISQTQETQTLISDVDEGNNHSVNKINPYVTQRDLREFSANLRKDFKNVMQDFGKDLEKIERFQDQLTGIRGNFNELKSIVMQRNNNSSSNIGDERYDDLISKLSVIEESLNDTSLYSQEIAALKRQSDERKVLEKHLKNNDWDLRKRMESVERASGITPQNAKKKTNNILTNHTTKNNKRSSNSAAVKYQASMTRPEVEKTPEKRIIYEKVKVASSKSVTWKNKHRWKISMISDALTQIQNVDSNDKKNIGEGVEVMGCGIVLDINVSARKVTTQHCVISTKGK